MFITFRFEGAKNSENCGCMEYDSGCNQRSSGVEQYIGATEIHKKLETEKIEAGSWRGGVELTYIFLDAVFNGCGNVTAMTQHYTKKYWRL
jgi:hypothetical protein